MPATAGELLQGDGGWPAPLWVQQHCTACRWLPCLMLLCCWCCCCSGFCCCSKMVLLLLHCSGFAASSLPCAGCCCHWCRWRCLEAGGQAGDVQPQPPSHPSSSHDFGASCLCPTVAAAGSTGVVKACTYLLTRTCGIHSYCCCRRCCRSRSATSAAALLPVLLSKLPSPFSCRVAGPFPDKDGPQSASGPLKRACKAPPPAAPATAPATGCWRQQQRTEATGQTCSHRTQTFPDFREFSVAQAER